MNDVMDVMGATKFEYHFRYAIHAVIYVLGFWSPWLPWLGIARYDTWHLLMTETVRTNWLTVDTASLAWIIWLVIAIFFAATGGWFRVWGTAYIGSGVVHSPGMHGEAMLADGPYRRTRNPLYLGTLLHTFGVALIMPPTGTVFTIVLIWIFQVRLALAEEPYLTARFGEPYREYAARVPRFIPALGPRVPAAGAKPQWLQSAIGEIYMIGVTITLAAFGWTFHTDMLIRGVLVSLGVFLVVRAFLLKPKTES